MDLVAIPSDEMFLIEHFIRSELCQTHDEFNVRPDSILKTEPVTFDIEASFLWLEDKTVQVILRAIKNTFMRFLKEKARNM